MFYLYQIENLKNNKKYIGITKDFEKRKNNHLKLLRKNKHHNYKLQKDFNIFGEKVFSFKILEISTLDYKNAYQREKQLIDELRDKEKFIYNIAPGGLTNPMFSKETQEKMKNTKQKQVSDVVQIVKIDENIFKVLNIFPSAKEAARITGRSQANISRCCNRQSIQDDGNYWCYSKDLKTWKPKEKEGNWQPLAKIENGIIKVRTYERGVEGETLACGTGMAACFLRANELGLVENSTFVYPKSGEQLTLSKKNGTIYFKGAVKKVFTTTI